MGHTATTAADPIRLPCTLTPRTLGSGVVSPRQRFEITNLYCTFLPKTLSPLPTSFKDLGPGIEIVARA
jgi:hypothetical protein